MPHTLSDNLFASHMNSALRLTFIASARRSSSSRSAIRASHPSCRNCKSLKDKHLIRHYAGRLMGAGRAVGLHCHTTLARTSALTLTNNSAH